MPHGYEIQRNSTPKEAQPYMPSVRSLQNCKCHIVTHHLTLDWRALTLLVRIHAIIGVQHLRPLFLSDRFSMDSVLVHDIHWILLFRRFACSGHLSWCASLWQPLYIIAIIIHHHISLPTHIQGATQMSCYTSYQTASVSCLLVP